MWLASRRRGTSEGGFRGRSRQDRLSNGFRPLRLERKLEIGEPGSETPLSGGSFGAPGRSPRDEGRKQEFQAHGRGRGREEKKGPSRPLPGPPRATAREPGPGTPTWATLCALSEGAQSRSGRSGERTACRLSEAIQHLRRSTQLQAWPARMSHPKSPSLGASGPQTSRSALRVRPPLLTSVPAEGRPFSRRLTPRSPRTEAAAARPALGPASPSPLPLCLAGKCCKPQVPAFLGRQQARGMLDSRSAS